MRKRVWRDIFTCVVTGPRVPAGASAVGAAAVYVSQIVNVTYTQHRRGSREYCTVLLHN